MLSLQGQEKGDTFLITSALMFLSIHLSFCLFEQAIFLKFVREHFLKGLPFGE